MCVHYTSIIWDMISFDLGLAVSVKYFHFVPFTHFKTIFWHKIFDNEFYLYFNSIIWDIISFDSGLAEWNILFWNIFILYPLLILKLFWHKIFDNEFFFILTFSFWKAQQNKIKIIKNFVLKPAEDSSLFLFFYYDLEIQYIIREELLVNSTYMQ